jgi:hypothetical protein
MDIDRLTRHITDFSLAALRGAAGDDKSTSAHEAAPHQETGT